MTNTVTITVTAVNGVVAREMLKQLLGNDQLTGSSAVAPRVEAETILPEAEKPAIAQPEPEKQEAAPARKTRTKKEADAPATAAQETLHPAEAVTESPVPAETPAQEEDVLPEVGTQAELVDIAKGIYMKHGESGMRKAFAELQKYGAKRVSDLKDADVPAVCDKLRPILASETVEA